MPHGRNGSRQTGVSRRCSADESTGQSDAPRSGVKLGSSCLRTATARAARQRPVSTGEHENVFLGYSLFKVLWYVLSEYVVSYCSHYSHNQLNF